MSSAKSYNLVRGSTKVLKVGDFLSFMCLLRLFHHKQHGEESNFLTKKDLIKDTLP